MFATFFYTHLLILKDSHTSQSDQRLTPVLVGVHTGSCVQLRVTEWSIHSRALLTYGHISYLIDLAFKDSRFLCFLPNFAAYKFCFYIDRCSNCLWFLGPTSLIQKTCVCVCARQSDSGTSELYKYCLISVMAAVALAAKHSSPAVWVRALLCSVCSHSTHETNLKFCDVPKYRCLPLRT